MADKYWWLKLDKDFFKRHDIRIVECMPNGKDYILFYLKLLVESVSHNGELRFSETVPYNEDMLSTVTNTNVDIVRSAMKVFVELNMIEILEDETVFMTEVNKMMGTETKWARLKRAGREQAKLDNVQECPKIVQESKSKSKSKSKNKIFIKPTLEELKQFIFEELLDVDAEYFFDYYESKGWKVGNAPMKDWKCTVKNWHRRNEKKEETSSWDALKEQ